MDSSFFNLYTRRMGNLLLGQFSLNERGVTLKLYIWLKWLNLICSFCIASLHFSSCYLIFRGFLMLALQNEGGGFATYELTRSYSWLEVIYMKNNIVWLMTYFVFVCSANGILSGIIKLEVLDEVWEKISINMVSSFCGSISPMYSSYN